MSRNRAFLVLFAATLAGIPAGIAVAELTSSPPAQGTYKTAAECSEAVDLYSKVGFATSDYFAPDCPSRDDVLTDIANAPSDDIAAMCEIAVVDGRPGSDVCQEFLDNRGAYLEGVEALKKEGIDLNDYAEGGDDYAEGGDDYAEGGD